MDIFCIRGGTPLHGRIALHGAKNAALPLLAATLATGARCELLDCPDISDVTAACAILRHLGCAVEQHGRNRCSRCRLRMPVRHSGRTHAENARCRPVPRAAARALRHGGAEPARRLRARRAADPICTCAACAGWVRRSRLTASIFRPGPTAFTAARSRCRFQASAQRRISSLRRSAAGEH